MYGYARQSPARYVDPDGRFVWALPFILGAVSNFGLQMGLQLYSGRSWSEAFGCVKLSSVLIAGFTAQAAGGTPLALLLRGKAKRAAKAAALPPALGTVVLNKKPHANAECLAFRNGHMIYSFRR